MDKWLKLKSFWMQFDDNGRPLFQVVVWCPHCSRWHAHKIQSAPLPGARFDFKAVCRKKPRPFDGYTVDVLGRANVQVMVEYFEQFRRGKKIHVQE